jgi:hypothetical protein
MNLEESICLLIDNLRLKTLNFKGNINKLPEIREGLGFSFKYLHDWELGINV